jgi:hypothetical protein
MKTLNVNILLFDKYCTVFYLKHYHYYQGTYKCIYQIQQVDCFFHLFLLNFGTI